MVEIIKKTEKNDKYGTVKTEVIERVDSFSDALGRVEILNKKNTKKNVTYTTGGVIWR